MKKSILWNTIGSIFYCVCQWLITILVVRMDNYETAGFLSLAMTTSSSFSAISLFSMRNYQVSDIKAEYTQGQYVSSRIWTCILSFLFCGAGALLGKNSVYEILCILAFMLVRVAEALVDVLHGVNQAHSRYDLIGKSYMIRGLLTIGSFAAGMLATKNLFVVLLVMALVNLAAALLYDWGRTKKLEALKLKLLDGRILRLLASCAPIVGFTFLLNLENLIPKTLLKQQFGAEELGIYSSIASPTLVVQVFASVVFNPFLMSFSLAYQMGEWKRFRSMFHKALAVMAGLCAVVHVGAVLLGRFGLSLLFGEDILEHYYLFLPIVWCTILTGLVWVLSALVVAMRKIKWLLIGMAADFLLCLGAVGPLISDHGKNGVSIVQILVLSVYIVYLIVICEVGTWKRKENR